MTDKDRNAGTPAHADDMRRTKIIATLGPASRTPEMLAGLLDAGTGVFRVNASHGTHGEHAASIRAVRELAAGRGLSPGVMLDLQGPKIRLGVFEGGSAELRTGSFFTITVEPATGNADGASTTYGGFGGDVKPGDRVLLADGRVVLRAMESDGRRVKLSVVSGGTVRDKQGINLPGVRVSLPSMTEKDALDLEFGLGQDVDMVALSFVRSAADVQDLRRRLQERGKPLPIVAKIEKPDAVENLEGILEASDGVMVARGDLGVELALARVPGVQKAIIERARMRGKFVITATQMLESMIENPGPTRAEVSDVANAIFDGTDAVMLSAETATGRHPVEAVRTMSEIALEAEAYLENRPFPEPPLAARSSHMQIIAEAAYHVGLSASVKAIVVYTASGETARMVARYRPRVPVFAFCEDARVARSLSPIYGVHAVPSPGINSFDEMVRMADLRLLGGGWSRVGDSVLVVAGSPFGVAGSTNLIKLHRVGDAGVAESAG